MDKFSIIMPSYNNAEYLVEAVNSCLDQTYGHFEVIIVNDGSTDSTPKLLNYLSKDGRIKVYNKKNGGPASDMNYGIEKSTGDIICFAASDDIQLKNKLQVLAETFEQKVDFCYTGYYHGNIYGQPWEEVHPKPLNKENIYNNDCASGGGLAFRRKVFDKVKFRDMKVNEDQAFIWDLYKKKYKYALVDIPTYIYRLLPTGMSFSRKDEVEKETKKLHKEIDDEKET